MIERGSPDQPRDDHGRWTSGSAPDHPDWMHGEEGAALADSLADVPSEMQDGVQTIDDARTELETASQEAQDVLAEEDDVIEAHGVDSPEYAAWEKRNDAATAEVADKAMALRQAIADHIQATGGVLDHVNETIAAHAKNNGVRK